MDKRRAAITRRWIDRFAADLAAIAARPETLSDWTPRLRRAYIDGLQGQIDELRRQLAEYEASEPPGPVEPPELPRARATTEGRG